MFFLHPWRKGLNILKIFVSCQWKVQEHFSAFPCLSLQLLSCFPVQEGQFPFPLLLIFLPFICNCLFIFLFILGCCGTECAVGAQPALWNQYAGKSPKQNFFPTLLLQKQVENTLVQQDHFPIFFSRKSSAKYSRVFFLHPFSCPWFFCRSICRQNNWNNTFFVGKDKIDLGCRK